MIPPLDRMRYAREPPSSGPSGADGRFELSGIFGPQVIMIPGLSGGWFVDSVRHGDEDITGQPREFRAGDDRPVVIVLCDRSATLFARPVDADGKPRADAQVVLIPADPRRWQGMPMYQMPLRNKDGFIEWSGQKPGDYIAAALPMQDLMRVSFELGTLEPLAKIGRRITLVEGEPLRIDLPVTALEVNR